LILYFVYLDVVKKDNRGFFLETNNHGLLQFKSDTHLYP